MTSVISEKGQLTIPKKFRDRFGLRPGTVVTFEEQGQYLVITKVLVGDGLDRVYGSLELGCSTDDLMRDMRGEPDAVDGA